MPSRDDYDLIAGQLVPKDGVPLSRGNTQGTVLNIRSLRPAIAEAERLLRWCATELSGEDVVLPVLVTIGASGAKKNTVGHFAKSRWSTREGEMIHEVKLYAEHLNRSVEEIMGTIVHEFVHMYNENRDEKDAAKSGRHNKVFKEAAEEMGLAVQLSEKQSIGWGVTQLGEGLKARILEDFVPVREAWDLFRTLPEKEPARKTTRAWHCSDGCSSPILRVAVKQELDHTCNRCACDVFSENEEGGFDYPNDDEG